MPDYLTTKEVAELLRIKERKVYDLASSGVLPCSKAIGKLLFPRDKIDAWIARNAGPAMLSARPNVFLGSHDPLLEWALRESRCAIATLFDSSADGLARFGNAEGIAAGIHLPGMAEAEWNVDAVATSFENGPVVLVEWAWRNRGIALRENAGTVASLADLKGLRVVPRQENAGAQRLLEHRLAHEGLSLDDLQLTAPALSESDLAQAVASGAADAGFALQCVAVSHKLAFVPVARERFDILVDRRAYFEPPFQALLTFCRSQRFADKANELQGYDISGFGTVRFNGA